MKSLTNLVACLLEDSGRLCSVETTRDYSTIIARVQHEGLSFLTITLPDFATDFERALELGRVDSTLFSGWKRRGCLPAFLQGFTSLVFDNKGRVRNEPLSEAVLCVRQICRFFKKVRVDCSQERKARAFEKYVQTEYDLEEIPVHESARLDRFTDLCRLLWSQVFQPGFTTTGLVPRHGPGATAERVLGNQKFVQSVWNERLELEFPFTEHIFTNVNHMLCTKHGYSNVSMRAPGEELPVRVIQVPKTLKTPRTIAIEPICMQYTQQAVARWVMLQIQRHPYTAKAIRFNDQRVNAKLALTASLDKSFSTIDLSDASDRVSYQMVRRMLVGCPDLWAAADACRSRRAELPDGRILDLKKFASMGSALCFPIESMYFYSIVVHAFLEKRDLPCTHANIVKAVRGVNIFGDDIIVPKGETDSVIEALNTFGCKVNSTKSFWLGNFRESCGMDAFNGNDVTVVYLRELPPSNRRASQSLLSWISTSNQLHTGFWWKTADYMKNVVERLLGSLPVVLETSPGLGWTSFLGCRATAVMCRKWHVPLVRTYTVRMRRETDVLDGYPALLKYFLRVQSEEIDSVLRPLTTDKKHLTSSARSGSVSRKRQWVPSA